MDRSSHLIAVIALALAACGDTSGVANAQAYDPNVEQALAKADALETRVNQLETEVASLKAQEGADATNVDTLFKHDEWQDHSLTRAFDNDRIFAARTGLPFDENSK